MTNVGSQPVGPGESTMGQVDGYKCWFTCGKGSIWCCFKKNLGVEEGKSPWRIDSEDSGDGDGNGNGNSKGASDEKKEPDDTYDDK